MLQIIESPSFITFAKNDVIFRIRTLHPTDGQSYRAHGSRASLSSSAAIQDGTQITLTFEEPNTISRTTTSFMVKNTPTLSTDIKAPASLDDIMAVMQSQPIISPFIRFYLNPIGTELIAEAIDTSKDWIISFSSSTITTNSYPRVATNAPAGYKINCDIFFEKKYQSNDFQKIASREIKHREDGSDVYINLSEVLSAESFHSLPENPFAQYSKTTHSVSRNIRRYFVIFNEITTLGIANTYTEEIKKLIIGGIANPIFLSDYWFSTNWGSKSIFSNRPIVKNTRFGIPEWLSFFNYSTSQRALTLLIGYNGIEKQTDPIQAPPFECVTFAISPDALAIPPSVKYYWVQVLADGTLVSTTRYYVIDNTPYKSIRVLAYLNSFGVPETVTCIAGVTEKTVIEAENFNSVRGSRSAGSILRNDRYVKSYEKEYTYRTGTINSNEKEALTELTLSPVLFDITGTKYIALTLKEDRSQSEMIRDTEETIYSYEWIVIPRIQTGNFSTEAQLSDITTISEPQFLIDKGKGNTTPAPPEVIEPWGTGGGGSGGSEPTAWIWEPLTPILDTDLVLFAKTDDNGKLIGFRWLKSGDYMRHIRGLPLNALSHTVGLGYSDAQGNTQIDIIDNDSKALQTVKELPNELKE